MGFHCPQCVEEARRRRPTQRTQFGAPVRADERPVVTWTVIGICVVLYALQVLPQYLGAAGARVPDLTQYFAYAPLYTSESPLYPLEPWRMLTSALVHSPFNAVHLLFNMVALWFIGRVLEPAIGRLRHLALLVLSALGGSVAVLWLSEPTVPVVGASGAVYGLFAALFMVLRATGGQVSSIVALIVVNLVISFMGSNISWQGHIGGLVTGAAVAAAMTLIPRSGRRTADGQARPDRGAVLQWAAIAGIVVVLVALTALGAARLTPLAILG